MKTTNKTNQPKEPIRSPGDHFDTILKRLKIIGPKDSSVLFTGDTGTGKEILSDYLVEQSNGKDPYEKINIMAVPERLIESELFGHKKGAFTGALHDRKGKIEASNEGTLLLDELGSLTFELQEKLLRVIENGEFQRVGENITRKMDVRYIAATSKERDEHILPELKARFDFHFKVLSLKERQEDIPYFIEYFLQNSPFNAIEVDRIFPKFQSKW